MDFTKVMLSGSFDGVVFARVKMDSGSCRAVQ